MIDIKKKKTKTTFINKTISNESILYDHDKLYFLVAIPTCYYCIYAYGI